MADFYDTLGVARDATPDAIRAARKRRAKETHPDAGGSTEAFQEVEEAARVLLDPRLRLTYDQTGTVGDGPEKAAVQMARQAIFDAIMRCPDVDHTDLVKVARLSQAERMDAQHRAKAEGLAAVRKLEKALKRMKARGARNLFGDMIQDEIAGVRSQIAAIDQHLAIMERAAEIIEEHVYIVDKPDVATSSTSMRSWIMQPPAGI